MGREIRRVDVDWQHPRDERGHFRPLYNEVYETAAHRWLGACIAWAKGEGEDAAKYSKKYPFFWDWDGNPPDKDYYLAAPFKNPVAYQIYETVSEGTPVSPVFPTEEAMLAWMTAPIDRASEYNRGADWQSMQGMTRAQAEKFVKGGSSPSLIAGPGIGVVAGHRAP